MSATHGPIRISNIRTGKHYFCHHWLFSTRCSCGQATTPTVLGSRSPGEVCVLQHGGGTGKGPQYPGPPLGQGHTGFREVVSPPCGLAGYCHLVQMTRTLDDRHTGRLRVLYKPRVPAYKPGERLRAKRSHLWAKVHENFTHQKFFLSSQHKTIKRNLYSQEQQQQQRPVRRCVVILDNVRQMCNSCISRVHKGNAKEVMKVP